MNLSHLTPGTVLLTHSIISPLLITIFYCDHHHHYFIFILNLPPNIPKIKIKFDWPVLTILRKWIISAWFQKFGVIILNGVTLKKKVMIWFFLIQKDNKFACKITDYWKQNREGKSQRQLGLGCGREGYFLRSKSQTIGTVEARRHWNNLWRVMTRKRQRKLLDCGNVLYLSLDCIYICMDTL